MAKQCSSCKPFIFFIVLFLQHLHTNIASTAQWKPMQCDAVSINNPSCSSFLYATSEGRNLSEIAAVFNSDVSLLQPIKRPSGMVDVLVGVPCTCEAIDGTMSALFHDTRYLVQPRDTPEDVKSKIFSGLAFNFGDGMNLISGDTITVYLPCGCSSAAAKSVLSYAVGGGYPAQDCKLVQNKFARYLKLEPEFGESRLCSTRVDLVCPHGS